MLKKAKMVIPGQYLSAWMWLSELKIQKMQTSSEKRKIDETKKSWASLLIISQKCIYTTTAALINYNSTF